MKELGIWEPLSGKQTMNKNLIALVKSQTIKSAIESACLLLRVDDIVSGMSKKKQGGGGGPAPQMNQEAPEPGEME